MLTMTADQLQMACEVAKIGTFSFNLETEQVSWNNVLRQILNIPADEEITLTTYLEMVNEDDRNSIKRRNKNIINGKVTEYEDEYRITPRGGTELWLGIKGKVYPGTKIMYGIIQDITEQKKATERMLEILKEKEASKENIRQLVKMIKEL